MLFNDYSSAFNTIEPYKLVFRLVAQGLNPTLCNWVLDFVIGHPQVVKVGINTTRVCVQPLLYSLFTKNCMASNSIIKFADNTTVVMIRQPTGRR
jgi:hypothetical protein